MKTVTKPIATQQQQTQDIRGFLDRCRQDFPLYCEKLVKVKPDVGPAIPLHLNFCQRIWWQLVKFMRDNNYPVRMDILKGRKIGFSLIIETYLFWQSYLNTYTDGLVVAHLDTATTDLFNDKTKFIYDNLPDWAKPQIGAINKRELYFKQLESRIACMTAGHVDIARSANIHNLHNSEVGFWVDWERVSPGLFNTVPKKPGTSIFTETTPNGHNAYKDYWDQTVKDFGLADYYIRHAQDNIESWLNRIAQQCLKQVRPQIPLFITWFMHPDYSLLMPRDFDMTDDEKAMQKEYRLSDGQVCWYRETVREQERLTPGRGRQIVAQEFPHSPNSAFIASGQTVFNDTCVQALFKSCDSPKRKQKWDGTKFIDHPDGELWIWEEPIGTGYQKPWEYAIGVDIGEGRQLDDSVIEIIRAPYTQVAEWADNTVDPLKLVPIIGELAVRYNKALVAVETNSVGMLTNDELSKIYWNLYQWEYFDTMIGKNQLSRKMGWYTNQQTKEMLITLVSYLMLNKQLSIGSKRLVYQMNSFTGQDGPRDDVIMAYLIAIMALHRKIMPFYQDPKPTVPPVIDYGLGQDPAYIQTSKPKTNTSDWGAL